MERIESGVAPVCAAARRLAAGQSTICGTAIGQGPHHGNGNRADGWLMSVVGNLSD